MVIGHALVGHEVTALDLNGAYLSELKTHCRSASRSIPPATSTTAAAPASI